MVGTGCGVAGVAWLSIGQLRAGDGGEESEAGSERSEEHLASREEILRVMLAPT